LSALELSYTGWRQLNSLAVGAGNIKVSIRSVQVGNFLEGAGRLWQLPNHLPLNPVRRRLAAGGYESRPYASFHANTLCWPNINTSRDRLQKLQNLVVFQNKTRNQTKRGDQKAER
jgi:hypothetical protein